MQTAYRRDIDGLRAVAVLPVVLFHAGLQGMSGGFVGVDVFFVISGYLITQIIAREVEEGRFTILGFYDRRVRRIFPALFAMIAVALPLGYVLLFPQDFKNFAQSVAASAFFGSNVIFLLQGGYFGESANVKPLLHTWSLAVEEQFYIFFPPLIALLARFRLNTVLVIAGICAASFAASLLTAGSSEGFYLTQYRVWELGLGALLALGAAPKLSQAMAREAASFAGLAMILAAVFLYDETTPFPGLAALPPCLGAALIIHAGASGPTMIGRLLGAAPLVFVGLISYSLYLWHWPVIVFSRYASTTPTSPLEIAAIVGVSILLATLSWRFIERPFRARPPAARAVPRNALFVGGAVAMAAAASFGVAVHIGKGWSWRFSPAVGAYAAAASDFDVARMHCMVSPDLDHPCVYGATGPVRVALWGDSHAASIAPAIETAADKAGERVLAHLKIACAPALGVDPMEPNDRGGCRTHNEAVLQRILADPDIHTVILATHFQSAMEGPLVAPGYAHDDVHVPQASGPDGKPLTEATHRPVLMAAFLGTIETLRRAGKRVVLVYPIPESPFNVPTTLARIARDGGDPSNFVVPRSIYHDRMRAVTPAFDAVADGPDFVRLRPEEYFCAGAGCRVALNGAALYYDDDHLNYAGAALFAPFFEQVFTAPRLPRSALGAAPGAAPGAGPNMAAEQG
ncbi:MAG: acyltransferase [Hyphomonadaceae bacterium]|nr:acyltransferase [Hyphomonadaceae bacterium]